jgi:hypothetical protein
MVLHSPEPDSWPMRQKCTAQRYGCKRENSLILFKEAKGSILLAPSPQ